MYSRTLAKDVAALAAQPFDTRDQQPIPLKWADGLDDWWQFGWDESNLPVLPFGEPL